MQPKLTVDLVVAAREVLPVAPGNTVLSDHAVAVSAGRIVALAPRAEIDARYEPRERVERPDHALLPGFVDAHTNAAAGLLRSLRPQTPFPRWFREVLAPAGQGWLGPDFVRDGTRIAIGEMLLAGVTCFADHTLFPEEAARAASAARMRVSIGLPYSDRLGPWASDAATHLVRSEALWDEYRSDPWISLYFAPECSESLDDAALARLRRVVDELDARVAMPVGRSPEEIAAGIARHGVRPLERLDALGFLRPGFAAVHMNELDDLDVERAARTGTAVIACPLSDLRLHRASCALDAFASREVPIALGSGAPLLGGAVDAFAEARQALFAASSLEAAAMLRIMTMGGATVLGLGSEIGSIEVGKAADLICVELSSPAMRAHGSAIDAVVLAATRRDVRDVWIGGRAAVANGRLVALDEDELEALQEQWHTRLRAENPT